MTTYSFGSLSNGTHLAFDPRGDALFFNTATQEAGAVRLILRADGIGFRLGAKTIWLDGMTPSQITTQNIVFQNGGFMGFGDDTVGSRADFYGQHYDLATTSQSHYLDGLGGADYLHSGSGDDYLVGNAALAPLAHVSQVAGTGGPNGSFNPSISADGRFVGFYGGGVLFGSQSGSGTDVFVKDMASGVVTNEHKTISGAFGLSGSGTPVISADGRFLAFWSNSDLTEQSVATGATIYRATNGSGAVVAVSTNASGAFANGASDAPDMSADGRYIVFESRATNLVAVGASSQQDDIYLKDMQTGTVRRVSTSANGTDGNADSALAAVSATGAFVVFHSAATNLTAVETGGGYSDVYLYTAATGKLTNITGGRGGAFDARNADVAGEGIYPQVVVFETGKKLVASDTNNTTDVYAYDIVDRSFSRVSATASDGQGNGASQDAVISDDGRFVAFRSFASNLVAGDTNGFADIFVKDLVTGAIALISRAGAQGNQHAGGSIGISAGGDWIVFETSASNLAASDDNGAQSDVFRVANPLLIDTLRGGAGDDIYDLQRADHIIEAADGGFDTLRASFGMTLATNLEGLILTGNRNVNATGNGANNLLGGNRGNNILDGRTGHDTATYAEATGPVVVSLAVTGVQATGDGADRLLSIESLTGSAFNDRLTGNGGNNRLDGGLGNDLIRGGGEQDSLVGGAGVDQLFGGSDAARDHFVFGSFADSRPGAAVDTINEFLSGTDKIDLTRFDANVTQAGLQDLVWRNTTAAAHSVWRVDVGADMLIRADVNGDTTADFEIRLMGVASLAAGDVLL